MTAGALIAIISAGLSIIESLLEYAQQKKWMDAGAALAALQGVKDANVAIANAQAARTAARNTAAADPDSVLRDDDGFKRD